MLPESCMPWAYWYRPHRHGVRSCFLCFYYGEIIGVASGWKRGHLGSSEHAAC